MLKNISEKNTLSLDGVCYLIERLQEQDDIGNIITKETVETMCFCAETSAFSSEFFQAGQQGVKPQTVLLIDNESYNSQVKVNYNNVIYSVYRTFPRCDGIIELYLTEKPGEQKGGALLWQR